MTVPDAELIALQRSAAMQRPHAKATIQREQLIDLVSEIIETRRLLTRLGGT